MLKLLSTTLCMLLDVCEKTAVNVAYIDGGCVCMCDSVCVYEGVYEGGRLFIYTHSYFCMCIQMCVLVGSILGKKKMFVINLSPVNRFISSLFDFVFVVL